MSRPTWRRSRSRGGVLVAMLVSVVLCAGVCAAVLVTNSARSRESETELSSERAFELAEAGADWAVTQLRIADCVAPSTGVTTTFPGVGQFSVSYTQGNADGSDNDGDGVVDNAEESEYAMARSTGTSGGLNRTVEVVVRKAMTMPPLPSALQINVTSPVLDLSGVAFTISGADHDIDGTPDPSGDSLYGIASLAPPSTLESQISPNQEAHIDGLGGTPSIGQSDELDLDTLMSQARAASSTQLAAGSYSNLVLGTATSDGMIAAYCGGDLHLSGSIGGAGVLTVDGDLEITGDFEWVGIVLVRGRVTFSGGGNTQQIIGGLVVGQDVSSTTSTTTIDLNGHIDIAYSSSAVSMASARIGAPAVMSWREVANP